MTETRKKTRKRILVWILTICVTASCLAGVARPAQAAGDPVTAFVTRLYQICLNRKPDAGGLEYWLKELKKNRLSGGEVAEGFFFSTEYLNKKVSETTFLTNLYKAFFDRAPDTEGMKYWQRQMRAGLPRRVVLRGFARSDEFKALCEKYGIAPQIPDEVRAAYKAYAGVLKSWKSEFSKIGKTLLGEDAYKTIVYGYWTWVRENSGGTAGFTAQYALSDLNGDGIPELLIYMKKTGSGRTLCNIWTYDVKTRKAVKATPVDFHMETVLYEDRTAFVTTGKGSHGYDFYKLTAAGKWKLTESYSYEYGQGDAERSYYKNTVKGGKLTGQQKKISETVFNKAVAAHGKKLPVTICPANTANLGALAAGMPVK